MIPNYKELAARGVRGNLAPAEHDLLRSPPALQHWYDALVLTKVGVETQLSSRAAKVAQTRQDFCQQARQSGGTVVLHADICKYRESSCSCQPFEGTLEEAWLKFKVDYLTWRVRALKFLSAIEEHLRECKALKRAQHDHNSKLRAAIMKHRERMNNEDAAEEDFALWALVSDDEEPNHYSAAS